MRAISRERIERVARMYPDNKSASQALGITAGGFSRRCRRFGIATPSARKLNAQKTVQRSIGRPAGTN
jgi:hypothetical protein